MGKILWTALKVLLVLALVAALGVGAYFLCQYLKWPNWMAAVLLLSLFGIIVGIIFLRKVINRRRQEGFIKQVVEQDEAGVHSGPMFESRQAQDLAQRWQEAVDTLKHSHLKKLGNPVYVLPHYLVIGGPGTGKTSAIRGSSLPSAFPDLGHPAGDTATRNVDWWFFENAIVLDTTGRYSQGPGAPREEWKKLLALLANYRRKEPINGLIVTVPADKLGKKQIDEMEVYGRTMRQVIDQLMRVMGAKFPVYLLVTKLDQVHGMNSFSSLLPWRALKQAMGELNHKLERDAQLFAGQAVDAVVERLRQLRLLLLGRPDAPPAEALVFPEELLELKAGLQAFMRGAFQENPYQEAPTLRGIFFSSAQQEGETISEVMVKSEVTFTAVVEKGERSFFLQDFWKEILPRDRYLVTPIREFIRWRRSTRDLGLLSLLGITILILGLFGASFLKNSNAIESFQKELVQLPKVTGNTTNDMIRIDKFREEIIALEHSNQGWWLPRMGLNQSLEEERELKNRYIRLVSGSKQVDGEDGLLTRIDEQMKENIQSFDPTTGDTTVGDYVSHVTRQVNITKAYLGGADIKKLKSLPQPSPAVVLLIDQTVLPNVAALYGDLYLYQMYWREKPEEVRTMNRELQFSLVRLLQLKGENLEWLVAWANKETGIKPVTMSQFWEDKIDTEKSPHVPQAFTLAGKAKIEGFITQIESALDKPEVIKDRRDKFVLWYNKQYVAAWQAFAQQLLADEQLLRKNQDLAESGDGNTVQQQATRERQVLLERTRVRSRNQWHALAIKMTTFENPYFNFMALASDELAFLKDTEAANSFVKLIIDFKSMKSQVASQGFVQEGLSLARSVGQVAENTMASDQPAPKKELDTHMKAVKELQGYQKALQEIATSLDSPEHAYQMAIGVFVDNAAQAGEVKAPFNDGYTSVQRTRALIGSPGGDDELFWLLLRAPLDDLLFFDTRQAACALQGSWEEQVLAGIQGVPDYSLQEALFADGTGAVLKFVRGPAQPFLAQTQKSFTKRAAYGQSVPFRSDFLSFITSGSVGRHMLQKEYEVVIEGLPTDVNAEAREKPQSVSVEMTCATGIQRLDNYNYPVIRSFKWASQSCGEVKITIKFRDLTLTRLYPEFKGFPDFLIDFQTGARIFRPEDFPNERTELIESLRVSAITIRFRFTNQDPLIQWFTQTPRYAPFKITHCWER